MTKSENCTGCTFAIDCTLYPNFCGNKAEVNPEMAERIKEWFLSQLKERE